MFLFLTKPILIPFLFAVSSVQNSQHNRNHIIPISFHRSNHHSLQRSNNQYYMSSPSSPSSSSSTTTKDPTLMNQNKNNKAAVTSSSATIPLVRNFRLAKGFKNIYRCASTDTLSDFFTENSTQDLSAMDDKSIIEEKITSPVNILLNEIELILDLRSPSERDEEKAIRWMKKASFGIEYFDREEETRSTKYNNENEREDKIVYRIDVLSPSRLFQYLSKNWISSAPEKAKYNFFSTFDTQRLHEMRMDILNEKGLNGLYEAIIETSNDELFASLKAITEYLEKKKKNTRNSSTDSEKGGVAVHCVQGKDRTGLVIMLCQSIVGLNDEAIIGDYHLTEKMKHFESSKKGSKAAEVLQKSKSSSDGGSTKGKLDRTIFSGAPKEAMIDTLAFIRNKYGSVIEYLDSIGFDSQWRERFQKCVEKEEDIIKNVNLPQSRL